MALSQRPLGSAADQVRRRPFGQFVRLRSLPLLFQRTVETGTRSHAQVI